MEDLFQGKFVICRCTNAGVHAGRLVEQTGGVVVLKNARRLWYWKAAKGVALSGVAVNGLASGSKIDTTVELIRLTDVIETISCSSVAEESIRTYG